MKKIIKYISFLGAVLIGFTSCELTTPIDEIELEYQLKAELAITNESSARLALAGAYSSMKEDVTLMLGVPCLMAGSAGTANVYYREEFPALIANNPINLEEGGLVHTGMSSLYRVVNDANWILEKVEALDDGVFSSPSSRTEILGQVYGLRALAHLHLLRYWGQWYDESSSYGITLRLEPTRNADAYPRNTVAETYAQIHSDLDFAMANGPDVLGNRPYMTKQAAQAIKAKAYLYQGDYPNAASTAKNLIDQAGGSFSLSPTFAEMFDNTTSDLFENSELLFGLTGDLQAPLSLDVYWTFSMTVNDSYANALSAGTITVGSQVINYDSDRVSSSVGPGYYGSGTTKFPGFILPGDYGVAYFSRLSEVYLIYAEAEARSTGTVTTDALDALNAIRLRAGATTTGGDGFETYPASISLDQFLEAVRIEKQVELFIEQGEEWFDMVRFDWEDGFGTGFQVSDYKPTATNPDKFILPYSKLTIQNGNNVEVQNPSYE